MPKIARTLIGVSASGRNTSGRNTSTENAPAPSQVSVRERGFGQLDALRLQQAYAAYRKLLRDSGNDITQFSVLEVDSPVNIYGQIIMGCKVVKIDVNGNGRWDDDVDATIMLSHTSNVYHNVKKGDVICLPIRESDFVDDNDLPGIASARVGQAADSSEGGDSGLPDLTPVTGKKFRSGLGYFRPSSELYEEGLKPIAVFRPEDARYGKAAPFAAVYYIKSSRDRNSVREFLNGYRANLAGNNPHVYDAFNIICLSRILAVNGVPVEFMEELPAAERARLAQDAWENSERIRQLYTR
jgi:hypothetical protein